ncbi:MAG TPA: T9SS type A sorting domain-containing protein, partial [Ignavibacteriaceae bacterium]
VGSHRINAGEKIIIMNEEVTMLKITKQQTLPTTYNLEQNYPNPFNPSTTIKFSIPEATNVTLNVYNTLGEKVAELVNTNLEAGRYNYQWDASNIASGIYIYELKTNKFISSKKMILMK